METPNEIQVLEAQIEAILFTMGEAVEAERIAVALDHDVDTVRRVLRNMMDRYEAEDRGIQIIELDGSFQMCTKSSMYESIIKIAHVPKKHVLTEAFQYVDDIYLDMVETEAKNRLEELLCGMEA